MRRVVLLLFAVAIVLVPALRAQNVPDPAPARPTTNLTVEQRHVVKENVPTSPGLTKESADPAVSMGGLVPADVAVHQFPPVVKVKIPQTRAHRFFVKGNIVMIVNPRDNMIADVIE